VLGHEDVLEHYSEISNLEETQEYLFKHCDILLHEHSQSYMLLSCLEDEMNGKKERMKLVCRQSQILSHIQELGKSMSRDPRDVVLPFFRRITEAEYLKGFLSAVEDFRVRIVARAIEKRKEMDAERAAGGGSDDEDEEPPLGPGGLDPRVVMAALPAAMREAFESREISKLHECLGSMPVEEAKHWMKQCIDSGLWVGGGGGGGGDDEDEEGGEEEKA